VVSLVLAKAHERGWSASVYRRVVDGHLKPGVLRRSLLLRLPWIPQYRSSRSVMYWTRQNAVALPNRFWHLDSYPRVLTLFCTRTRRARCPREEPRPPTSRATSLNPKTKSHGSNQRGIQTISTFRQSSISDPSQASYLLTIALHSITS
jgi:hypothetical protein